MLPTLLHHKARNDAERLSAGSEAGIARCAHQAHTSGAVDQRIALGGYEAPEALCGIDVGMAQLAAGSCVNSDLHSFFQLEVPAERQVGALHRCIVRGRKQPLSCRRNRVSPT